MNHHHHARLKAEQRWKALPAYRERFKIVKSIERIPYELNMFSFVMACVMWGTFNLCLFAAATLVYVILFHFSHGLDMLKFLNIAVASGMALFLPVCYFAERWESITEHQLNQIDAFVDKYPTLGLTIARWSKNHGLCQGDWIRISKMQIKLTKLKEREDKQRLLQEKTMLGSLGNFVRDLDALDEKARLNQALEPGAPVPTHPSRL